MKSLLSRLSVETEALRREAKNEQMSQKAMRYNDFAHGILPGLRQSLRSAGLGLEIRRFSYMITHILNFGGRLTRLERLVGGLGWPARAKRGEPQTYFNITSIVSDK